MLFNYTITNVSFAVRFNYPPLGDKALKALPLASLSITQYCCLSGLDRSQWLKNKLWLGFFTGLYLASVSHFVFVFPQTSAWFNKGTMCFPRWFAYVTGILSCSRGVSVKHQFPLLKQLQKWWRTRDCYKWGCLLQTGHCTALWLP